MEDDAKCEREEEVVSVELPAPSGWKKKYTPMKSGVSNRNEIVFISPSCEEIKNKKQLSQFLRSNPGGPSLLEFDWGCGETPRRSARISKKTKALETLEEEPPKKQIKFSSTKKSRKQKDFGTESNDKASNSDKIAIQTPESAKDVEDAVVAEGITKDSTNKKIGQEKDAKIENVSPESGKGRTTKALDSTEEAVVGLVDNMQECKKVSIEPLDGGKDANRQDGKEDAVAKFITDYRNEGTELQMDDVNTNEVKIERIATQEQERDAEDSFVNDGERETLAKPVAEDIPVKIISVEVANADIDSEAEAVNSEKVAIQVETIENIGFEAALDVFVNEENEEAATKDIREDDSIEGNKNESKESQKMDVAIESLGEEADALYSSALEDDFTEGNEEHSFASNSRTHDAESYKEPKEETLLNDSHHREQVSSSKAIPTVLQNPQKASAVVGMRD